VKSGQRCANETAGNLQIPSLSNHMRINYTGIFTDQKPHRNSGLEQFLNPERIDFSGLSEENRLELNARRMFDFV
jgi:hypothetical protein